MKTRYKIFAGLTPFILGISMILIDMYAKSLYQIQSLEETLLAIGLVSSGMSIIGIAIMYEFVRRKYDIRK